MVTSKSEIFNKMQKKMAHMIYGPFLDFFMSLYVSS